MEERQHPATERQQRRFAERGEAARSRDLGAAAVVACVCAALVGSAVAGVRTWGSLSASTLGALGAPLDGRLFALAAGSFATLALPPAAAALAAALILGLAQSGGVRASLAAPKLERLNPLPRLGQMLGSREAFVGLAFTLVKLVAVGGVVGITFANRAPALVTRLHTGLTPALAGVGELLSTMAVRGAVALAAVGVLDYALNRLRLARRMRMTTQQLKDDLKEDNGDPQIKNQRRRRARELMRSRSLRAVAKADVVVTNPTHLAVALAYRPSHMSAPRVVAKGADAVAARIRAEARKASVPVVPSPPLARVLFRRVKVGREIPPDLFQAVAVVLAHVYRLRRRTA